MEIRLIEPATTRSRNLLILLCICLPLFFVKIGSRDLWAPDEPRFAQIAQEMLDSGDWTVPTMNGEKIALLPPLTYWSIAASSLPFGHVTEYSARLPMALAGLLCALAVFFLAGRMFNTTVGLYAGLILSTTVMFLHQAGWVQSDIWLVCFVTTALVSFYFAYTAETGGRTFLFLFYVSCAMGTLTKGPLAAGLPGLVILVFLAWNRDLNYFLKMGLTWGIPLFFLMVAPWYYFACTHGGKAFAEELLLKHNFGMFYDTWSHKQPFYYYLLMFPPAALPWFLLIPRAIAHTRQALAQNPRSVRFLFCWMVPMFLFFSISSAKQMKYILPLVPAFSIWIAAAWTCSTAQRSPWKILLFAAMAFMGVLGTAGILLMPALSPKLSEKYPDILQAALPCLLVITPTSLMGLFLYFKGRHGHAFACLVMALTLGVLSARFTLLPSINRVKSARAISERAVQETRNGEPLAIYGTHFRQIGAYIFYTRKRLQIFEDIPNNRYQPEAFLRFIRSSRRVVCLIEDDKKDSEYRWLKSLPEGAGVKTLDRRNVGSNIMVLISNR